MITMSDMAAASAFDHVSTAFLDRTRGQDSTAQHQPREPVARPRSYAVRARAFLRLPARKSVLAH
jgi:hypothetical protein